MSASPVTAPATDAELVVDIAAGDRAAMAELYDRYASVMLALAHRMLGGGGDAEDLLHDVFVEVWHKAHTYRSDRGTVRTWLLMRVRSRCLDRLRAAKRAPSSSIESLGERSSTGAHKAVFRAPDRRKVREAVRSLPIKHRTVLELGYFRGLTCSEIASREDIPLGTVKSRIASALNKLRALIADNTSGRPERTTSR